MPSPSGRMLNQPWVLIAESSKVRLAFFFFFFGPIYFFDKKMDDAHTQILNLVMHTLGNWAVREK